MAETLEITTLCPAPGLTADDFVQANADIDAYLKRQPGFVWRRIVETDDGRVIDIVAYDSLPHARAGAAGITGEMADSPVHATIDHDSVDWQLTTALHHVT
ncbi:hypothetical protein OG893_10845 [Streptomyces sp. NBC_01696]|uniref:hypothetical protein n=1 Tax=unclassified Streptomyces TaxID=2593676 RepID=UPI002E3680F3|nr:MULTISPECIES: hypothetical protein [unclassified Streptomyces]